jgi:hypothetical protein
LILFIILVVVMDWYVLLATCSKTHFIVFHRFRVAFLCYGHKSVTNFDSVIAIFHG